MQSTVELSPVRAQAVEQLSASLLKLQRIYVKMDKKSFLQSDELLVLAHELALFTRGVSQLVLDQPTPLNESMFGALESLAQGDVRAALVEVTRVLADLSPYEVPESVHDAMDKALCVTSASKSTQALRC